MSKEWSQRYKCCRYCKDKLKPHKGRGLCLPCYTFIWKYVCGKMKDSSVSEYLRKVWNGHIKSF